MQNVPLLSVGLIMYAVRCTRPDVAFAQNITSRFQQNPGESHWTAMKNILKYLRNTKDMFLVYSGNPEAKLRFDCYCNTGFETDIDDMKSLTEYVSFRCKQITALNEEISNLNNQLSKEKSTVSSLQEEKKRLKSDFKICEDELLDKQIQLENKINKLDNILVKMGQSIQTMHMLSPKPDSFYHTEQKMALGYQNPFYLKQAQQKQQSLYNGKVLLEKHDPPAMYDSEETLQLAQESRVLELEIERLLRAVVSQDIMSIVQSNSVVDTSNLQIELEPYNDIQQKIERLQAQLGDQKGKSKDTPCVSNTLDPLSQKLENENVELKFQVLNYAKENAHLKTTYKNLFDSISVTRTQTKTKIDSLQNKLHDTIYENAKLRAQLFGKVSEQKDITKGVDTLLRPEGHSSEVEVEEHPRNLLLSKNKKHMSSECNNVTLAIRNDKSKVVCAMCKQCLITANHDVCVLNYVNGMNSRSKKQKAKVPNIANQTKLKPRVKKPKKVGSNERLASPKPRKPRTFLRWSPTGRIFELKGKIIVTSEFECQSDCSNDDNACTSNP
ncbi:hypothetical protein Tco_0623842 [Tanacetum coccineum]|uniref:Retrotransposon protein, putative, Ty1-copia subclass n=1 Tax=Tanacetum coccineum TaxID=301880 RepID=A0ABQ4WC96_9ASTR